MRLFQKLPAPLAYMSIVIVLLAGCGNGSDTSLGKFLLETGRATAFGKHASEGVSLTREDLDQYGSPIVLAEIPGIDAQLYLVPLAKNGEIDTWATSSDSTLSFRDGLLAATRGLGPDLIESSTPAAQKIRSGTGKTERMMGFLDAADQLVTLRYECELSRTGAEIINVLGKQHKTVHVQERCSSQAGTFTNDYWFESNGKIRKSREFLADGIGYAVISRLVDR